jgi:mitochondrial-processing peptidase subunit beta
VFVSDVDHNKFHDLLNAHFMALPDGTPETNSQKPVVVGGEQHSRVKGSAVSHVAVALQAPGLNAGAAQVHALGVLQALLGTTGAHGGGAGAVRVGPQSHSRIARSIHNDAHSFIRSLTAFALPYSDAGLFGLVGSAADHEAGRLVDAMTGFLKDAASLAITDAELNRAKALYKLRLATEAESATGARDDLGHQLLLTGQRVSLADTLKAVDAVTASSVQGVAKAALSSKPSIAAIGSLSTVPRYDVFASALLK